MFVYLITALWQMNIETAVTVNNDDRNTGPGCSKGG